jgi:uncharacterized protein (TIGR00369 family)
MTPQAKHNSPPNPSGEPQVNALAELNPSRPADRQAAYERFVKDFGAYIPFAFYLGFELDLFEHGQSVLSYIPHEDHYNSLEVTHGGALMTLMDVSMACAARSEAPEFRVVTIEMKSTFFSPASGPLKAHGHLLHRTSKMAFVESKVYDAQKVLCAHGTGTFRYVTPR